MRPPLFLAAHYYLTIFSSTLLFATSCGALVPSERIEDVGGGRKLNVVGPARPHGENDNDGDTLVRQSTATGDGRRHRILQNGGGGGGNSIGERLRKCRSDLRKCNRDNDSLRAEREEMKKKLDDECSPERADCRKQKKSMEDDVEKIQGSVRRCLDREKLCNDEVEECLQNLRRSRDRRLRDHDNDNEDANEAHDDEDEDDKAAPQEEEEEDIDGYNNYFLDYGRPRRRRYTSRSLNRQQEQQQQLKECRSEKGACIRKTPSLRRFRNNTRKNYNKCLSDTNKCRRGIESLEGSAANKRRNLRRCLKREGECEEDLEECRDAAPPVSSPTCSVAHGDDLVAITSPSDICGAYLEENRAYVLARNITCDEDVDGPHLSSNVCLDCGGNFIAGTGGQEEGEGDGDVGVNTTGITVTRDSTNVVVHNCIVSGDFTTGIAVDGNGTTISNVRTAGSYIENNGDNNTIECSVSGGGGGGGQRAFSLHGTDAGCLTENVYYCAPDFVYDAGPLDTSCPETISMIADVIFGGGGGGGASSAAVRVGDAVISSGGDIYFHHPTHDDLSNLFTCDVGPDDAFYFLVYGPSSAVSPDDVNVTCGVEDDEAMMMMMMTEPPPVPYEVCSPDVCPQGVGPYAPP